MTGSDFGWEAIALIVLVVLGATMVVFLAFLVRTAYELKFEMKTRLDKGIRAAQEDAGKQARELRLELGRDIEKARASLYDETRRRVGDAMAAMDKRQAEFETGIRQERIQTTVTIDALRDEIAALTARLDELEREVSEVMLGGEELPDPEIAIDMAGGSGSLLREPRQ